MAHKTTKLGFFLSLLVLSNIATGADWPSLQGLENSTEESGMRFWGFVQAEYAHTDGSEILAGGWAGQLPSFNRIAPSESTSTFNIKRARIGLRGHLDNNNINYFFLTEFGNNGVTNIDGPQLTDASVTLNYIDGAHIRIGQFKIAQSSEAQQAAHTVNWINFTNVTNQLLLERFTDEDGSRPNFKNGLNGPVSAFRDLGVQVFDTFKRDDREFTYAVMVGNGNGISRQDNDSNKDLHLYLATEKVYAGKGPKREGFRAYAWYHKGVRTLDYANGIEQEQEFDRIRYGVGVTYRKNKIRAEAEYVKADGMIFNGTDGGALPGAQNNAMNEIASFNYLTDNQADGWYVDAGYKVLPKLELSVRYDELNRATDNSSPNLERQFKTLAFSAQYQFVKWSRATFNYEFRDASAPKQASSAGANQNLGQIDDRLSMQILVIF